MAKTEHYLTRFEAGSVYHIYNRTVDKSPLFAGEANYRFFLQRYQQYLSRFVCTLAFSLLPNHFHLMIRARSRYELEKRCLKEDLPFNGDVHDLISDQFRRFFQSYSLAFNTQHKRVGTLFQTPYKRALVADDAYLTRLLYYIHRNPQPHGFVMDYREWPWSSYRFYLDGKKRPVLEHGLYEEWFGEKDGFISFHERERHEILDVKCSIEAS